MLYHAIKQIENTYSFFNRKSLSSDFLLQWLESLGVITRSDLSVSYAVLMNFLDKKFLLYNPWLHPDELVLTLGHEIGHILLGHIDHFEVLFSNKAFFSKSRLEKDAGIIGFLCWLPTPYLQKLEAQGRLSVEELAWELKNCDTEWDLLYQLCKARLRIYAGFKKIEQYTGGVL